MSHPNRHGFKGILAFVDSASDKSPSGARGRAIMLPRTTAEQALPTLIGMGVNFSDNRKNHDKRRKCGVITGAEIIEDRIEVSGHLYAYDFPEIVRDLQASGEDYGMSFEAAEGHVENPGAKVWLLTELIFTGAAILLKKNAAYERTSIEVEKEAQLAA